MSFRRRMLVLSVVAALTAAAYGTAKYYTASLVAYVVEQALIQKLPAGENPALVRKRFQALLETFPERQAKLDKLLSLSLFLEKEQKLTPQELDQLLRRDSSIPERY